MKGAARSNSSWERPTADWRGEERELLLQRLVALEQGGVVAAQLLVITDGVRQVKPALGQVVLQSIELLAAALPPPEHQHGAWCRRKADHLPAGVGVVRLIGVVPTLGDALHLGGEEHGVSELDAGLKPDLTQRKPPVVRLKALPAGGEAEITHTDGMDCVAVDNKTAEAIDHTGEAMHLLQECDERGGA